MMLKLLLLSQCVQCFCSASQATDWLIHPPTTPTTLTASSSSRLSLTNGLVLREFYVDRASGAFCTTELRNVASGQTYFRALSAEGNITLNGTRFNIGGCLGQPDGHDEFFSSEFNLSVDPAALRYVSHTHGAPAALFDWVPGTRSAPTAVSWPPLGLHLSVIFALPPSSPLASAGVSVVVHYEMYNGVSAYRKWVEVIATGETSIVVDTLTYELLRAPNFAPEQLSVVKIQANNPVPFDAQIVPVPGQSFPGRTEQLWRWDPKYDQPGDRELHVTYTYYTFLVVAYGDSIAYGGSTGPGAVVAPGGSFTSLSVRVVMHDDNGDAERKGLAVRAMQRRLAPSLLETPLPFMITDISGSAAMRLAVDQAAAAKIELVIVGFGAAGWCGCCFAQLKNASFVSWFAGEVAYAQEKGVEVSVYTLMQHNGWGEITPKAEQCLHRDGITRGPTACFATDWHEAYRADVLEFLNKTKLGGIETDGQFEGTACADKTHDHHHNGVAGGWAAQMSATRNFNKAVKGLGLYQTGADAYAYSGANKWNHADTDAFGHLPLWEQMTVGRMYIYDSTINRLKTSGQIGINDLAVSSKTCSRPRLLCFDFVIGTQFLYGSIPSFRAAKLYDPADADADALAATILKWSEFYRAWRTPRPSGAAGLLVASVIHLQRPDSRHLEAVVHLSSDDSASHRGLLALVNPTREKVKLNLTVPLYYTGLRFGREVEIATLLLDTAAHTAARAMGHHAQQYTLGIDTRAGWTDVVVEVELAPSSYSMLCISTVPN